MLTRLIDEAYESPGDVIDSFRESSGPLSPAEKEALRRNRFRSGVETDNDEIDDVLH